MRAWTVRLSAASQSAFVPAGLSGDLAGARRPPGPPLLDAAGSAQPQALVAWASRALTAPRGGGGGNSCDAGTRSPAEPHSGRGSNGLSCQRRDVKQVSKAPHISAD